MNMHDLFYLQSSTAIVAINRIGSRDLHSIKHVVNVKKQSLKSYTCRKAKSGNLMTEWEGLTAPLDAETMRYERHRAWHRSVSKSADIVKTYQ